MNGRWYMARGGAEHDLLVAIAFMTEGIIELLLTSVRYEENVSLFSMSPLTYLRCTLLQWSVYRGHNFAPTTGWYCNLN